MVITVIVGRFIVLVVIVFFPPVSVEAVSYIPEVT